MLRAEGLLKLVEEAETKLLKLIEAECWLIEAKY